MVEFALVAPLFFFVVFGAIESGFMFRTHLVLEDMSRSAAREASIERNNANADIEILRAIETRDQSLPGRIEQIIIFEANGLDAELPAACIDGSGNGFPVGGLCHVYPGSLYEDVIAGTSPVATVGYPAPDRDEWENIGIYVEMDYNFVTGFFGDMTLSSTAVEVIELTP